MNDQQRAAMQMALGALEKATMVYEANDTHPLTVQRAEDAITALREALVSSDHEKQRKAAGKYEGGYTVEALAQPQGESDLMLATTLNYANKAVEAAIEATKEKADWGNLEFQCHALQEIGAHWYDGKVRNQWIADTCHEMKKQIAEAIRSMK